MFCLLRLRLSSRLNLQPRRGLARQSGTIFGAVGTVLLCSEDLSGFWHAVALPLAFSRRGFWIGSAP